MTKPEPGEARPITIDALLCRCCRCDHVWIVTGKNGGPPRIPTACPGCKHKGWRAVRWRKGEGTSESTLYRRRKAKAR